MNAPSNPADELPFEIGVLSVSEMIKNEDDFLLIDVRTKEEVAIANIEGTTLVTLNELPSRLQDLDSHRDRRIVIHCHHGGRSLTAAEFLRENGFPKAQSMAGGIEAWSVQVDPSIPRY